MIIDNYCLRILLFKNSGIRLRNPHNIAFAKSEGIPCETSFKDAMKTLKKIKFDYLFSIVNHHIIPNAILQKPKQAAINYHDAPLPRYAGTNATSWAILNNEKTHGMSWHIMVDKVDAGDILQQACFDVSQDETALSLNMKCYDHAIQTFSQLLKDLLAGSLQPIPQNLNDRTFYAADKRPPAGAVINWLMQKFFHRNNGQAIYN